MCVLFFKKNAEAFKMKFYSYSPVFSNSVLSMNGVQSLLPAHTRSPMWVY